MTTQYTHQGSQKWSNRPTSVLSLNTGSLAEQNLLNLVIPYETYELLFVPLKMNEVRKQLV
jgi:hypothetical protein